MPAKKKAAKKKGSSTKKPLKKKKDIRQSITIVHKRTGLGGNSTTESDF